MSSKPKPLNLTNSTRAATGEMPEKQNFPFRKETQLATGPKVGDFILDETYTPARLACVIEVGKRGGLTVIHETRSGMYGRGRAVWSEPRKLS